MDITITGHPVFEFQLTQTEIDVLMKLSRNHYDHRCKNASALGGFVYGWHNGVQFGAGKFFQRASWSELDTTLKILEWCMGLSGPELIIASKLNFSFHTAMSAARRAQSAWQVKGAY